MDHQETKTYTGYQIYLYNGSKFQDLNFDFSQFPKMCRFELKDEEFGKSEDGGLHIIENVNIKPFPKSSQIMLGQ